ncbi:MAG: FkbM family methyltransferase [Rhizonema sp. PD37]|nr:FkbM family methyltransferase [Rhizonema sp. PD37]
MLKHFAKLVYLAKRTISVIAAYKNFPLWFFDRLHLLPRKKVLYKLRNGINFVAESNTLDCQFISEMFIDEQYTSLPGFKISPTDIIVDCGAHKGIFTTFAAKNAPLGKVISYEASPETYQSLVENLEINGVRNVEHFNSAVGLSDGTVNFYLAEDPGCSMIVPAQDFHPESGSKGVVTVTQVGFENIINGLSKIDFLKMDIEGIEFAILMNCSHSLLEKVKRIALEYHPEFGSLDALIEHLQGNGFQASSWQERRLLYAWRQSD